MIGIVTDSTSQLTPEQADEAGVLVVPITVTIDGEDYLEGVELTAEDFYGRLTDGVRLSTSQPSPGRFAEIYRRLIDSGASEVVSIHLDEASSGTLNSARLAAESVDVPVHLVDSRTTSYGLGALTLHLADHVRLRGTGGLVEAADTMIAGMGTVFILQDLGYVLRGGRMRTAELPDGTGDVPVLGGYGGRYEMIDTGRTIDDLVDSMAEFLLAGSGPRHIAIALAAPDTIEFTDGLEARMRADDKVASLHRYRMGPSVALHPGPGTAGRFRWPAGLTNEPIDGARRLEGD